LSVGIQASTGLGETLRKVDAPTLRGHPKSGRKAGSGVDPLVVSLVIGTSHILIPERRRIIADMV
jgi:hypothetical protein